MKDIGYGKEYKYAHDFENNFVVEDFLPEEIKNTTFFKPGNNPRENEMRAKLKQQWKEKYKY
jgi:putative ATPase